MTTRVILEGAPSDVGEALAAIAGSSRAHGLTVSADPLLLSSRLEQLERAGHVVVLDTRLSRKVLLELPIFDLRRLRLLEASDHSDALAAARRALHAHLDMVVAEPACPEHAQR